MDTVEDGSASPESIDENLTDLPTTEDQLSKNRSKRKPSKTQIKHIAQGAFTPTSPNGQIPKHAIGTDGTSPNMQNLQLEKRKSNSAQHQNKYIKNEKYDNKYGTNNMEDLFNDVTQGIFRDSNTQEDQTGQTVKTFRRAKRTASGTPENATNASRSPSGRPPPCYPCGICGKVFRVPSRYDSHMLGHSKGKPFCCNTCGKMFASQDKLDRHLPVHNCDRHAAFTCETCGKVCVNWRAYLYHMKAKHTESGGKRFSCNLCGRQFHSGQRLRNHMASHEVGKNHCCHVCGKLFESSKKLAIHSLVHNLSSMHDQNLQCSDCGRQYTEWIAFKQHMKTHGSEGVHYPCGICGETFSTQYEKEKHKRIHKQVQCGVCFRYFRSSSVLSVHLRIHTGEKPYNCGLCDKDFSQLSVMKIHMRIHMNEQRFDCKICTAIFSDVMDYFKHYVAHFEDGNLQCELCGKVFDNIKKKNRHMAAHQDKTDRQCHVCGKEFSRVSHLEAHLLCHSDRIPLMCKACGKMFSSQEVLTAHYSVHVKSDVTNTNEPVLKVEGPLFCGLCGKMFKDQEYLNKHMKRHENITQEIKREDVMLDEDMIEVENGPFPCKDCGKAFDHEDHLKVHKREHTGERPHICVMCGESFTLRRLLFEHGLTHKRKDFGSSASHVPQTTAAKHCDFKTLSSSLSKSLGESDTGSGSETDTDCDHEENVRQSKGKHAKKDCMNSTVPKSYVTLSNLPPPLPAYTTRQEYSLPQTGIKFLPSQSTINSVSSLPSLTNISDSHPALSQMQPNTNSSFHDPRTSHSNTTMLHELHLPLVMKNDNNNMNAGLHTVMSETQMPMGVHMAAPRQDLKTDVSHPIPMSYSRTYMAPPSMSNVLPHCPSLHSNFHGSPGRFHTDLHHNTLTNFQLLPQTAFHDQTHHM